MQYLNEPDKHHHGHYGDPEEVTSNEYQVCVVALICHFVLLPPADVGGSM